MNKVTELENYLFELYKNDENVTGIFISGSCANGTFDEYSDVDFRFIVNSGDMKNDIKLYINKLFCGSKKILFFEPCCFNNAFIAHFDDFIKADVFFYTKDMLTPSPWLKSIKILKDTEDFITNIVNCSKDLTFSSDNASIESDILKYFATSHECYRRLKREEYLYANYLFQNMKEIIIQFYDYTNNRASLSWYRLEKRFDGDQISLFSLNISKSSNNMKSFDKMNSEFLNIEKKLCEKLLISRDFDNDFYILNYYIK